MFLQTFVLKRHPTLISLLTRNCRVHCSCIFMLEFEENSPSGLLCLKLRSWNQKRVIFCSCVCRYSKSNNTPAFLHSCGSVTFEAYVITAASKAARSEAAVQLQDIRDRATLRYGTQATLASGLVIDGVLCECYDNLWKLTPFGYLQFKCNLNPMS